MKWFIEIFNLTDLPLALMSLVIKYSISKGYENILGKCVVFCDELFLPRHNQCCGKLIAQEKQCYSWAYNLMILSAIFIPWLFYL